MAIIELSRLAKAARINAKAQRARVPRDLEAMVQSLASLDEAAELLQGKLQEISENDEDALDLAVEIGDCLGVKGGTLRDLGRFEDAGLAYKEGRKWEMLVEQKGGLPNSYCLVQQLVNMFLHRPESLRSAGESGSNLRQELIDARNEVNRQMRETPRGNDPWAKADVAVISVLLRDDTAAADAWDELELLTPPANVYTSTAAALEPLLAVLQAHEPADHRSQDRALLEWLRAKGSANSS